MTCLILNARRKETIIVISKDIMRGAIKTSVDSMGTKRCKPQSLRKSPLFKNENMKTNIPSITFKITNKTRALVYIWYLISSTKCYRNINTKVCYYLNCVITCLTSFKCKIWKRTMADTWCIFLAR